MKGWQVALLIGGLAAAGGVAFLVLRKTGSTGATASKTPLSSGSSTVSNIISQVGTRALSMGIDNIENEVGDLFS